MATRGVSGHQIIMTRSISLDFLAGRNDISEEAGTNGSGARAIAFVAKQAQGRSMIARDESREA